MAGRRHHHGTNGRLGLVGDDIAVPLVTGGTVPYVHLDYAASAPCLNAVGEAVATFLPWYSSVHRGTGLKSVVSSDFYEGARRHVARFIGARPFDTIVFTRNTTDSINLLERALPPGAEVVVFETEHHANLLPWRRRPVTWLPASPTPALAVERLAAALAGAPSRTPRLVAITGASNVTGEIAPLAEIVAVAHAAGSRVVVDAAQLAPHHPISMTDLDIDYLALSGHKLCAPFGAGVLAGRPDWLEQGEPALAGGGAVRFVSADEVFWSDLPARLEAGSPNVVGAVALGAACRALQPVIGTLAEEEQRLASRLSEGIAAVPGTVQYRLWCDQPRIGVVTFNLDGYDHSLLAAILSAEYGIGVRNGCFCAHPLMVRLLRIDDGTTAALRAGLRRGADVHLPGAVRVSLGIGSSADASIVSSPRSAPSRRAGRAGPIARSRAGSGSRTRIRGLCRGCSSRARTRTRRRRNGDAASR